MMTRRLIVFAAALLVVGILQPAAAASSHRRLRQAAARTVPDPTPAGAYLDKLFDDYTAARSSLTSNFTKRSRIAVVYMCYEREDIIRSSLSALLRSEGLDGFDVFISQDGGGSYTIDVPMPANLSHVIIRHPENLCTGLHHYFVKSFAFDIMGYEGLIVVEEDNILHPQALQMLRGMLELSQPDPQIGLVAITDMDNTLLLDEDKFSAGVQRAEIDQGHLWVYAVHTSRYQAVWQYLRAYYDVIKRYDYRTKTKPPLQDEIVALLDAKGLPKNIPLSQDAFFVNSLAKAGYIRRLTTMVRLFEPVGWQGLHFNKDPSAFYAVYGRGMYEGRISASPFEVAANPAHVAQLERDCKDRLNLLYQQYLGRNADPRATNAAVMRLLTAKLNAVELMRNVLNSAEHRRRMKEWVVKGRKN